VLDLYTNYVLYSHITKEEKTMGNLIETSLFEEMLEAEEGFGEMVELIHEVDGEVITESVEDVLERELLERENMVDDEEVDVITDHLDELGQLEMEAELSVGI
tara:strand:- start:262 stop:570 length:309 start_codon:yes stop_codon:yes gene_type:complete